MARNKKTSEGKTGVEGWNERVGTNTRAQAGTRRNRTAADRRRRIFLLVALAAVCVASIVCLWPIKERITRGLWLKGGTSTQIAATADGDEAPSSQQLTDSADIVRKRLGQVGVSEYAVNVAGDDALTLELPWNVDGSSIAEAVGGTGSVEFVRVDEIGDADALVKINAGTQNVALQEGTYTSFMDGSTVTSATVTQIATDYYAITMQFNDEGAKTFQEVSKELAEDSGRIAIVVDGRVVSAPSVSSEIDDGEVSISGEFTPEEANALKAVLESGKTPLALVVGETKNIGPLVGKAGLWALAGVAAVAFVAVAVFSCMRLRKLGWLVAGSMAVYAVLLLGMMALASRMDAFVLTIPGVVAGLVVAAATTFASWRVCACFASKVRDGRNVRGAALSAPREGTGTLAYPCVAVFVVGLVLLLVPMASLREVGMVLVLGILAGCAGVFWYAVTLLRLLSAGAIQANPAAWGVEATAKATTEGEKKDS